MSLLKDLLSVLYLPSVLACLACSRALCALTLVVFYVLVCWACVLGVLYKMVCLAWFKNWHAWRASWNDVFKIVDLPSGCVWLWGTCELQILNTKWCIQSKTGNCYTYTFCAKFRISYLNLNFYTHL